MTSLQPRGMNNSVVQTLKKTESRMPLRMKKAVLVCSNYIPRTFNPCGDVTVSYLLWLLQYQSDFQSSNLIGWVGVYWGWGEVNLRCCQVAAHMHIEATIYSRTDIFSDRRLQKS